jgi:hypothetical protein
LIIRTDFISVAADEMKQIAKQDRIQNPSIGLDPNQRGRFNIEKHQRVIPDDITGLFPAHKNDNAVYDKFVALSASTAYKNRASFYADVASLILTKGTSTDKRERWHRVLSNLAELDMENGQNIRTMMMFLEEQCEYSELVPLYVRLS